MPITDAQIHLTNTVSPSGAEPMTAERFLPIMAEYGIDRALVVPPLGTSPDYAISCAVAYPDRFSVMPWHDPAGPPISQWLDRPGVRAMRIGFRPEDWPRLRPGGDLLGILTEAQQADVPVSCFGFAGLPNFATVAARLPTLTLIIDHANLIASKPYEIRRRTAEVIDLATVPNVLVKIAAMPAFSGDDWPFADVADSLRRIVAAFGPNRLLWGSDHTLVSGRGKATYQQSLDFARDTLTPIVSAEGLDAIFDGTISAALRWPR